MSSSSARKPAVGRSAGASASPARAPGRGSPFRSPGALAPRPNVVELPSGHSAKIEPPLTSSGFIGNAFSMDSLEFLRWAAIYFRDDNTTLCVLLFLMGSQEPGGLVGMTQKQIAEGLATEQRKMDQAQVSRAIKRLTGLGLVHMPRRGRYQLQPAATLRGGSTAVEQPVRPRTGASTVKVRVKVDQLSLLADLIADPEVPEAFRKLAQVDPELPGPESSTGQTRRDVARG